MQRALTFVAVPLLTCFATTLASAQSEPTRTHPRIWLDAETRVGIEAQRGVAGSAVERGAERCRA
ncbi:MAG TPA: hypothetical protein VMS65_12040, partial [Polyangiaceae bacterium]|nr:hypothetical protein [Polyangiaceae bacterium]